MTNASQDLDYKTLEMRSVYLYYSSSARAKLESVLLLELGDNGFGCLGLLPQFNLDVGVKWKE